MTSVSSIRGIIAACLEAWGSAWATGEDSKEQPLSDFADTELALLNDAQRSKIGNELNEVTEGVVNTLWTKVHQRRNGQTRGWIPGLQFSSGLSLRRPFVPESSSEHGREEETSRASPVDLVLEVWCDTPGVYGPIFKHGLQCAISLDSTNPAGLSKKELANITDADLRYLIDYTETHVEAARTPQAKVFKTITKDVLDCLKSWTTPDAGSPSTTNSSDSEDDEDAENCDRLELAKLSDHQLEKLQAAISATMEAIVSDCREKAANFRMPTEDSLRYRLSIGVSNQVGETGTHERLEIDITYLAGHQTLRAAWLRCLVSSEHDDGFWGMNWTSGEHTQELERLSRSDRD